jgi:hypothetical protein
MKTKLVTSFYTDITGFPFFGHGAIARHERYLHSLRAISNTGEEIICFCNKTQIKMLQEYINLHNLNNVKLKISNLNDLPNLDKMIEIKKKTDRFNTYHEVDWNKFYLLSKEIDEDYDYLYWIDVGLSHPGIMLDKYNPDIDKADGMSATYWNYSYTNLFKPELFEKINDFVGDKLLNLGNKTFFHSVLELNNVLEKNIDYSSLTVGGIIGGNMKNMEWFINEFNKYSEMSLSKDTILNHEAIMATITNENKDRFSTFEFVTWYHDDYWSKTPYFDVDSIKDLVHFAHFFDKILKI